MDEILIPISFFAMIAAIVVLPRYFRERTRQRQMETLQTAYEKGQPVPPELIASLNAQVSSVDRPLFSPADRAERDLRGGVMLIAAALGLVALGWALSYQDDDAFYILTGVAAIPGFIGLARIGLGLLGRGKSVA